MAKRRGWAGSPPKDDEDARNRIVEAAARCIDRHGPTAFSLSQVATELGVTRPTVYRHFPSTDELFSAVGQHAMQEFVEKMSARLEQFTDPVDWIIEGIAIPVEWLPMRPHMTLLLAAGRTEPFARGVTSPVAVYMTHESFRLSSIDWRALGFTRSDIDAFVDLMLRLIASLLIDPPNPPYTKAKLRRFLRRWIAPAVEKITTSAPDRVS